MKVVVNPDETVVKNIRYTLEKNNGYCPCALEKNKDTKCMCKDFQDKIKDGYVGLCKCGLYKTVPTIIYLCGDTKYRNDFLEWNKYFSINGAIVLMPGTFYEDELNQKQFEELQKVHAQKMTVSEMIFVIDKYGVVSESLKKDLDMAKKKGKIIKYASEMKEGK